jgi:hypothetical protein
MVSHRLVLLYKLLTTSGQTGMTLQRTVFFRQRLQSSTRHLSHTLSQTKPLTHGKTKPLAFCPRLPKSACLAWPEIAR